MKLHGKKIEGINVETLVIPRGDNINDAIVFKCQAVLDMQEFDRVCPPPKAPMMIKSGGKRVLDLEDPKFKFANDQYAIKRVSYIVLKSLQATPELEWETVNMGDSDTWGNYEKELRESGFSQIEIMRIINACMSANCLNEDRLEKARNDFLASVQPVNGQLSQQEEQQNIPSGKPVND
jgi:hypothetical protein